MSEPVVFQKKLGCIGWARIRYALPQRGEVGRKVKRKQSKCGEEVCVEGAGLSNVGNTCYMNSCLQALFHSKRLCLRLHSHVAEKKCPPDCRACLLWQTNELRQLGQADQETMNMWQPFLQAARLRLGDQENVVDFAMPLCREARQPREAG